MQLALGRLSAHNQFVYFFLVCSNTRYAGQVREVIEFKLDPRDFQAAAEKTAIAEKKHKTICKGYIPVKD